MPQPAVCKAKYVDTAIDQASFLPALKTKHYVEAQEAWMAVRLEQMKSKQEILTTTLIKYICPMVYMGCKRPQFYGKPLAELDLAQTALIAGFKCPFSF